MFEFVEETNVTELLRCYYEEIDIDAYQNFDCVFAEIPDNITVFRMSFRFTPDTETV